MDSLRKVLSVNTTDLGGGAERVAWSLFQGLERRGLDSWLAVGQKKTDNPRVVSLWESPYLDYTPYQPKEYQRRLAADKARDRDRGYEDFHFPYSNRLLDVTPGPTDVVLCHNLHGGYFDLRALIQLSARTPVFVVMHDAWLMTGHCAYTFDCARWETGCGECPALETPPAILRDGTRFNWVRKQNVFAASQLRLAAPTRWLLDQARRSMMAPAILESRVIPCPVDVDLFRPADRRATRASLELPVDAKILVFAANRTRSNPFKDCALIERALERVAALHPEEEVLFLGLGESAPSRCIGRVRLEFLPYQPAQRVAQYLQAADVYVHAAKAENFGLITAEAQACGTPVVATAVGGLPEVVMHEQTGLLTPPGDAQAMAAAIVRLLVQDEWRLRLGDQAADRARHHWAEECILDRYLEWFAVALQDRARGAA